MNSLVLFIFSFGPPGNNESSYVESILVKGPAKCRPFLYNNCYSSTVQGKAREGSSNLGFGNE